ncbi:hypothetical protein BGX28_007796 [Mortierella sp. GBA30]|nr:hypothetical protein BGX28_007796 [Mortierella sp. GBA30]
MSDPSATTSVKKTAPVMITRSTSASALPSPATSGPGTGTATPTKQQQYQHQLLQLQQQNNLSGSTATSPFLAAVEHHHYQQTPVAGPGQLRSTTHSPAFLAKFYDSEHPHRLAGTMANIPWLSLPGAAVAAVSTGGGAGAESPTLFGRRRSDVGLHSSTSSSGASTPGSGGLEAHSHEHLSLFGSPQQENPHPVPPQAPQHYPQQQHHQQHLLSPQELVALGRNNSPMPLNEALPHYLRKKNADSLQAMERSRSSPGSNLIHTAPGSPFMLPITPGSLSAASHGSTNVGGSHITSPSHLLFPFPGASPPSTTAGRIEIERSSSTGVLPPVNRTPHLHRHHHQSPHIGSNVGASVSTSQLGTGTGKPAAAAAAAGRHGTTTSFFRTSTPSAITTGLGGGGAAAATGYGLPFGHSNERDLHANKEVHA